MLIERERIRRSRPHLAWIAIGCFLLYWPAVTTNVFGDGLAGYEPTGPAPEVSLSAWLDGDFQAAADRWWRERFGLRFFFVKLDNQLDFWLFDRTDSGEIELIIGDGGWYFQGGDVDAYCRVRPPTDEATVRRGLAGIRALQDALDQRGVPFVFLLTPNKSASYPERLPDDRCAPHGGAGYDYDVYRPLLDEYGIRTVDGYALLMEAKDRWPETTLFSLGGAHWNQLGAYPAATAVLDAWRGLSDREIPPLELRDVVIDHDPDRHDRDLIELQNLLFPDTDYPVPHPEVHMAPGQDGRLRVALVGMSFLEQIALLFARSGGFERVDHYWYYQTGVREFVTDEWTPHTRETVAWEDGLLAADAIVLDLNMLIMHGEHVDHFVEDALAHLDAARPSPIAR